VTGALFAVSVEGASRGALAQVPIPAPMPAPSSLSNLSQTDASGPEKGSGLRVPDSEKLKIQVDLLAGWSYDAANAALGFESQGRVGYGHRHSSGPRPPSRDVSPFHQSGERR